MPFSNYQVSENVVGESVSYTFATEEGGKHGAASTITKAT